MPTIVANPDPSDINTSANAAEWVRSTEQWAHVYCAFDGTVDFSTGTVFEVKVYVPIACKISFNLEGSNGVSTELSTDVSEINTWTQLSFDFAGAESGVYNKIVIFFDFSSTTDNTYYFDDVTGPAYTPGSTGEQVDLPVTFDNDSVNYDLSDFGGNVSEITTDPTNEENNVAKTIKTDGAETWAGTTVGGADGFANPVPFTETFTTMSVDVYSPEAGLPVRLKVEDSSDGSISVETDAYKTVAMEWETLYFDFSNVAEGTPPLDLNNTYNKASIFFNFGTSGAEAGELTFYWDNMIFIDGTGIKDNPSPITKVYPNPATDVLYLETAEKLNYINIYTISGHLIYSSDVVTETIDLTNFPSGIYKLQGKGLDNKSYHAKFIVK